MKNRQFVPELIRSTDESDQGMYSQLKLRGGTCPDDPVYALWNTGAAG